jgi:hypothetical protein
MNSLSYACPEMIEHMDGLSVAARAAKLARSQADSKLIPVDLKPNPENIPTSESILINLKCELRPDGVAFENRFEPPHDTTNEDHLCEIHHRVCRQSWNCGECGARLRERKKCHEWVEGWCGGCGMLNVGPSKEKIVGDDEKVREVWQPLDGWVAKVLSTMTAWRSALAGLM